MGAGDRWHEHVPVKDGDPIISPAILLLVQGQESTEQPVLPWEADDEAGLGPESTPVGNLENEDVLANLLRAIESTDIAALFPSATPPESAHPTARSSVACGEITETGSPFLQEPVPEAGAVACSQSTPCAGVESKEALTNLLRTSQDTDVAATLEGIQQADCAEPINSASAQPAETAGAAFTASGKPEMDAATHLEPTRSGALEWGESDAMRMGAFVSGGPAAGFDGAPTQFDAEPSEFAPAGLEENSETASIQEPPVFRARGKKDRHPKRVVRRRNANRGRSNYLLSIAAPADAPPASAAADAQTSEPLGANLDAAIEEPLPVGGGPEPTVAATLAEPAEMLAPELAPVTPEPPVRIELEPRKVAELLKPVQPLPALAATVAGEPERPLAAKLELTSKTPILPAVVEGGRQKSPVLARLGAGIGSLAATGDLIHDGLDRAEMRLENWFQKWLGPPDPRRTERVDNPPLVAYHWIADVSQALKIADVSAGGLHLVTKDRWSEGNIISMTLQRTDREKGSPDSWIAVDFLVMRWCEDGMAGAFMAATPGLTYTVAGRAGNCADKKTLVRFVDQLIDAAANRLACK